MPEQNDIGLSTQTLADLLARERFLATEESKANMAATAAPLIYKSLQQNANYTDAALPNAAMNMLAPAIGSWAGLQNASIAPQVSRGMSPFDAGYISGVNTPMGTGFRNDFNQQMGGAMGDSLGAIANNLGFNRLMGMSPQQLSANMSNLGQSQAGQFLTEMAMRTPTMQAIMGGDPQRMQESIFANRHQYGLIPGSSVSPMDLAGQMAVTEHAMDLNQALKERIYPRGIVPDYNFTRGFRPEEMGETMAAMAERGAPTIDDAGRDVSQGMRGMNIDPGRKVQALGEMNRVLESISDLMGGGSIQQLLSTLDGLTQLQWPSLSRPKLEQTFREMSATANLLNVSGQTMMATTQQAQYGLQGTFGIGQQQAALGVTAGAYTGLEASAGLASTVLAIAASTGKPLDIVMAQQTAATALAMNSSRGRDTQHLGYLAQEGMISPDTYATFKQINAYGDVSQSKAMVDKIFRDVYGSTQQGRDISNSPGHMQQIRSATWDTGIVQGVYEDARNGQMGEFMDRSSRDLQGTSARYTRSLQQMTGLPMITGDQRAEAQRMATVDYFNNTIGGDTGKHLARLVDEIYATGSTPSQGAARMNNFLNSSPETAEDRERIKLAQAAGVTTAEIMNMRGTGWSGAQDFAMTTAGLRALQTILPGDTDVRDLLRERTNIATAMRKGASPDALATMNADFAAHLDAKFSTLSPDVKQSYNEAAIGASRLFFSNKAALAGTLRAEAMIDSGRDQGMSFASVAAESRDVGALLQRVSNGDMSSSEALLKLTGGPDATNKYFRTLDASTMATYSAAISAGKGSPELTKAIGLNRSTTFQLERSGRGVSNTRVGAGAINNAEAMNDFETAGDLSAGVRNGMSREALLEAAENEKNQDRRMTLIQRAAVELTRKDANGNPVQLDAGTAARILALQGELTGQRMAQGPRNTAALRQDIESPSLSIRDAMVKAANDLDDVSGGRGGGARHGGAFAGDITTADGSQRLAVGGGKKESLNAILKDFLGHNVSDTKAGLREFSGMSYQDLQTKISRDPSMAPKLSALVELRKKQQDETDAKSGKKPGSHGGAAGNYITGVLTLRSRSGQDQGTADFQGKLGSN